MGSIVAVAFLVGCASSLLICEELTTAPGWFADMEACRAALPALIRDHERQESAPPVVMGKCRLMIRPGPAIAPPNAGVVASSSR